MEKADLIARIHQLIAADRNAVDVYTDLAATVDDGELKEKFLKILQDEKRHVELGEKMLKILGV